MMPRFSALLLRLTYVALLLAAPGISHAADDATVEIARERFREGVAFYDQRQYEKARLAFLQAYALKAHPAVLLNLAQSELRAGRPEDAAAHFAEYMATNKEASPGDRQEAELGLDAARSKVGEVTVAVDATGAQILIDGNVRGVSPLPGPLYVPVGGRLIEARMNDRKVSKTVRLGAGQATTVTLSLRSGAAVAAVPTTRPSTDTEAPTEAEENEALPPPPLAAPAEEEPTERADVSTGGPKNFFKWLFQTPLAIAGGAIGVVGLGVGVGFAAASTADYNDADTLRVQINEYWAAQKQDYPQLGDARPCSADGSVLGPNYETLRAACQNWKDAADGGDSKKPIAIAGAVVGTVFIAGTVVYYFLDPKAKDDNASGSRSAPRVGFYPVLGGGEAGVGLIGRF